MHNELLTEATLTAVRAVLSGGWYLTFEQGAATGRPVRNRWTVCDKDGKLIAYGPDEERAIFRAWERLVFGDAG